MYINLCKYHCAEHLGWVAVLFVTRLSPGLVVAFVLCLLNVHVGFVFVLRDVNDPKLLVSSAHVYYILDVICVQVSR